MAAVEGKGEVKETSITVGGGSDSKETFTAPPPRSDSSGKLVQPVTPVFLSWQNIVYEVEIEVEVPVQPMDSASSSSTSTAAPAKGAKRTVKQQKKILNDVTGYCAPGQLLAIMGSSGAGKTSLLNVLSGRTSLEELTRPDGSNSKSEGGASGGAGQVLYNGLPKDLAKIEGQLAFVEQNDLFYKQLTVGEHLRYQAALRLGDDEKTRNERVEAVLTELNLKKAENNPIGAPGEGISGGERRRLSFATEILTDPSLLFIDEPTSGLDSFMATEVVAMLRKLANRGRTVVCTIHQPDPNIFKLFDLVLIMGKGQPAGGGRVGYFGRRDQCLEHFAKMGKQPGKDESPAPWLIKQFAIDPNDVEKSTKKNEELICFYRDDKNAAPVVAEQVKAGIKQYYKPKEQITAEEVYTSGWCTQLGILTSRSFRTLYRDRSILYFRLLQQLFLSLILGLLCFRLADAQSSIQSRKGAIFFILRFTMFINVLGQLMLFPMEMPIFQREYKARLYRSDTFFLAKNIAELPGQIIFPIIFMSIAYWMIGFADNGDRFLKAVGVLLLVTSAAASMGYFLSTLSTSVRGVAEAGSNILTALMLFDGFLINASTVPVYMRWLGDISIYKWSYELLSIIIWENFSIGCLAGETCSFTNGNQVLDSLSFSASHLGLDVGMLFASIFGYRLLSYFFVFLHARRKPKPA